jgi:serine/threonine-protein kinase
MSEPGNDYVIADRLGGSRIGEVYRGVDQAGAPVAVTFLADELAGDSAVASRFAADRAAIVGVAGPHLLRTRDLVLEDGTALAIVTELVEGGRDLRQAIDGAGRFPAAEVARIGAGVAAGLAALHAAGFAHGGIRPESVLLDPATMPPTARLADVGVAHLVGASEQARSGALTVPRQYRAPELPQAWTGSTAADLYALGALLYELGSGVPPFAGDTSLPAPGQTRPGGQAGGADALWVLIAALLAPEPALRPASAQRVADDLAALAVSLRAGTVPAPAAPAAPAPAAPAKPVTPAAADAPAVPVAPVVQAEAASRPKPAERPSKSAPAAAAAAAAAVAAASAAKAASKKADKAQAATPPPPKRTPAPRPAAATAPPPKGGSAAAPTGPRSNRRAVAAGAMCAAVLAAGTASYVVAKSNVLTGESTPTAQEAMPGFQELPAEQPVQAPPVVDATPSATPSAVASAEPTGTAPPTTPLPDITPGPAGTPLVPGPGGELPGTGTGTGTGTAPGTGTGTTAPGTGITSPGTGTTTPGTTTPGTTTPGTTAPGTTTPGSPTSPGSTTPQPAPEPEIRPLTGETVAFLSERSGTWQVYRTDPNGDEVRLTDVPSGVMGPVASPDGKRIAFFTKENGSNDLWVMNADGSGRQRLAQGAVRPVFSPGGSLIAYDGVWNGTNQVFVVRADGTTPPRRLTEVTGAAARWPSFSPEGTRVAYSAPYVSNGVTRTAVYSVVIDGTDRVRLSDNGVQPIYSPDGGRIAFTSSRDGDYNIYMMSADGTGETRLTSNTAVDWMPTFSPDGTRIMFLSNRDKEAGDGYDVHVMDAKGRYQARLTTGSGTASAATFSPDGKQVAYNQVRGSGRDEHFEVHVVNTDGTGRKLLTKNGYGPMWAGRPAG